MSIPQTSVGLTAAGTTQATALSLNSAYNQISTCAASAGVVIAPTLAVSGTVITIRNDGANSLSVYPPVSGTINSLAANAAYALSQGSVISLSTSNGLAWYTFQNNSASAQVSGVVTLSGTITTAQNILASQSGSVFILPQATANTQINLPAVQAGLNYKFIVNATADGTHTQTISAATAVCMGQTIGVAAGLVPVVFASHTNLILGATAGNLKPSDWCTVISDGTNWYCTLYSSGTASAWTTS